MIANNIYPGQAGVFLCTAGTAEILVNNQAVHIRRGALCIISPINVVCGVSQSGDYECVEVLDEFNVFYPLARSMFNTFLALKLRENPCVIVSEDDIRFFTRRKAEIEAKRLMMQRTDDKDERIVLRKMVELLEQETRLEAAHIFMRNHPAEARRVEKSEEFVYNFIISLHRNYKQERSVSFYAGEARLSPGYFTSVIKEKTGRTPSEWIATITITQAKTMLSKTAMSVKEISSELGFPEQFTFRKYFKLHTGMSPTEYRIGVK